MMMFIDASMTATLSAMLDEAFSLVGRSFMNKPILMIWFSILIECLGSMI